MIICHVTACGIIPIFFTFQQSIRFLSDASCQQNLLKYNAVIWQAPIYFCSQEHEYAWLETHLPDIDPHIRLGCSYKGIYCTLIGLE